MCGANFISEVEYGEVGFVYFAEAESVGDVAFAAFDFDKVLAVLPAVVEGEAEDIFVIVCLKFFAGQSGKPIGPFATVGMTGI